MDRQIIPLAEGTARPGLQSLPVWALVFLGLIAWQVWMTLTLFGAGHAWEKIWSDEPIISGRHPLHLYHGTLGAQAFRERGQFCCYDPAFQAGYPKTPIFDSGSRPAELFLSLAGGTYKPAAYKVGLAVCCLSAPVILFGAAWGLGLGPGQSCLAAALGQLVWWSSPGRAALEAGDLDVLLAALAALLNVAMLIRFDRAPGPGCWCGLLTTSWLGWFVNPLLTAMLIPVALVYYLTVGPRHRLKWHLALLVSGFAAVAGNALGLNDLLSFWWIRVPVQFDAESLNEHVWQTVWAAPIWGEGADKSLTALSFLAGAAGVYLLNQNKQRAAARSLGMVMMGFLGLAIAGVVWPSLGRLGTERLMVPALWFATMPAVYALARMIQSAGKLAGSPARGTALGCSLFLVFGVSSHRQLAALVEHCKGTKPLAIGHGPDQRAWIETIRSRTSTEARILWEDSTGPREASRWMPLLPVLTGRAYLGGLDSNSSIEHAYASLVDQSLAGRPIGEWADADLDAFCGKYNVGWVVCWSPAAVERFRAWHGAEATVSVADARSGWLFTLKPRSFALKGKATLLSADHQRIALANVIPEDGVVVLSMHHLAGMQASPGRVQVERQTDPYDPIPFIRLRVPGPVTRVTLTWEEP